MGNKWPEFRLDEITTLIVDCPHSTPEWTDSGVIVLRSNNIRNGALDLATPSFTTEEGYLERIKRAIPSEEDIVLTREAPMGEVCIIPKGIKCCLGQRMVLIRADKSQVIPEYLLYVMQSSYIQHQISWNEGTGTTVSNIRIPNIKALKIPLPKITIQRTIVSNLLVIDKKIAINTGINQTLEQMSQTLFKSWFVDFDPVIDNALDAGKPIPEALQSRAELRQNVRNSTDFKPLPAEIRSLFPSEFEETELGWVPKTWTISNLGKEFNITMGQSPSGSTYNEDRVGLPFFQGKTDFGFRFPSERIYCTDPKRVANKLDTLLSVRAPVGVTNLASTECIIGRGLAALRHKSGNIAFTYYSVSNLSDYFSVFNGEGTVFGSINQKDLKQIPLICSPTELINKFEELSGKWEEKIFLHCGEIENLSNLRDTLLPKLISGELSLEDLPDLTTDTEAA